MASRHTHARWARFVLALVFLVQFAVPAHAAEADEYTVFISGFTAFQNQDYRTAAEKMSLFLKNYPNTPMRDMALFWLARAHYKLGNRQDAARHMARFLRENPDTPLKSAVEEELLSLARGYEKGEPLVAAAVPSSPSGETKAVRSESAAESPAPPPDNGRNRKSRSGAGTALSLREKAAAEYKELMDRYPGTRAAAAADERLRELGKSGDAAAVSPQSIPQAAKGGRVVTLEVGQFAAAELNLLPYASSNEAGKRASIPFEVINRGNDTDSFLLETGFGPELKPVFVSAAKPDLPATATPPLAPGDRFKGILHLTVPPTDIDGRKNSGAVRVVSSFDRDVVQSKEVSLLSLAPYLRMVLKPEKERVRPGETVSYRIAMLNLGSAAAKSVSLTLAYPPQYEPIDSVSGGFRKEAESVLVSDQVSIGSGERKEFTLSFRVKDEAPAGQELLCRAELTNRELKTRETFLSSPAVVERVSGVAARAAMERLTVLPGQKVVVPFTVTNTGNVRESVNLRPSVPSGVKYAFFRTGGEASRQADEAVSGTIGPLSPKEEVSLKLEITAPPDGADGSESAVTVVFEPEGDREKRAAVTLRLSLSRPAVDVEVVGKPGRLKPGEISHLVMSLVNRGSATARDLEVRTLMPERMEVVASDPPCVVGPKGERLWRLPELGPGEKRTIDLAVRVRTDVAAGTNLRIENLVSYKDRQGNSY